MKMSKLLKEPNPYSKSNLRKNCISFFKGVNVKIGNKPLNENLKNLFIDIFLSTNWGVEFNTLKVDSDDKNLQKRINKLNKTEHKMLGKILKTSLNRMIKQGSR